MSTLDQTELKLTPHAKLIPDKEWRININLNDIMMNDVVQEFVNNEMINYNKEPATTRKYTEKELNRILADVRKERRQRAIENYTDFNAVIDAEWSKVIHPLTKMPAPDVTRAERENQLISMKIPSITETKYFRDMAKFRDANVEAIKNLNDCSGSPLSEFTKMIFTPVGLYTDYIGDLSALTDDILLIGCDDIKEFNKHYESEHLRYNNYCANYCTFHNVEYNFEAFRYMLLRIKFENADSLKNHLSVIYKNEVSTYRTYDQLSYNSPETSNVSYIRYTLLLQ